MNYKVGLSIKPNTNLSLLIPYLDQIDLVLIMSVEPGFGGQKFMPHTLITAKTIQEMKKDILIEMDGGINDNNIDEIETYVDIAVVGSYITNSNNYNKAINNLKK